MKIALPLTIYLVNLLNTLMIIALNTYGRNLVLQFTTKRSEDSPRLNVGPLPADGVLLSAGTGYSDVAEQGQSNLFVFIGFCLLLRKFIECIDVLKKKTNRTMSAATRRTQ